MQGWKTSAVMRIAELWGWHPHWIDANTPWDW